jgi:hypothetical protein
MLKGLQIWPAFMQALALVAQCASDIPITARYLT